MAEKTITFKLSLENLNTYISYIRELSLIDNTIIMLINNENLILYSFVGSNLNDIHAFKDVLVNTNNILVHNKEIEDKIIFIIKDSKKFVRNLQNFVDFNEDIKMIISYNNDNYSNYLKISNSKLNIKEISGDPILIGKEITKQDIEHLTNKDQSLFNFTLSEIDYKKIKNLSNIDTINDILYINILDNELFIGENKWELKICNINISPISISFPKKYFKNLRFINNIEIYVFETYILISDNNSDLMIVLETSV